MLKNEYLGAKIGVDTAENEPEKSQQLARFAEPNRASHWLLNSPAPITHATPSRMLGYVKMSFSLFFEVVKFSPAS